MLDAAVHPSVATQHNASETACGRYWAVCQTHPQAERWATANIQRLGYVAYLPLYATQVRDRAIPSLRHTVIRPLFTSYTFAQLSDADPWTPIRYAQGVAKLLMAGDHPNHLAAGVLEALQATEAVRRHPVAATPSWAPGTPCSLAAGPMAGLPAVVLNTERDQVRIGVMFLGQVRQITVAPECLVSRRGD